MDLKRDKIQLLHIENDSDVGECRRKGVALAKQTGFTDLETGEVAIIITELGTNVLKHGGGTGEFLICRLKDENMNTGMEFWCCDFGKGFSNSGKAMEDGVTDSGSLGIGLGAIRRLSDEFEINPGDNCELAGLLPGTRHQFKNCIRTRKWLHQQKWAGVSNNLLTGSCSIPKPGEQVNGDEFVVVHLSENITVAAVIDGLGHGKEANLAARMAREQILARPDLGLDAQITQIHNAIRGTRGATVGIIRIDTGQNKLFFSGIGNIEGQIYSKTKKTNLLSYGGIVGHNIRTPRIFEFDFNKGETVCLYSDGIVSRWQYETIDWQQPPQKNAEYIVNQFSRLNDDATLLIIRYIA